MALTLLSICQAASEELLYDAPQTVIGNSDANAVLLKRSASAVCKELIRDYSWQALQGTYTFSTVIGQYAYDLPSDFRAPVALTFWDAGSHIPMDVVSSIDWQTLQSGYSIGGIQYRFVVEGNQLKLFPIPTSVTTISFSYLSNAFATAADGSPKDDFTLDSDVCRLDGDLVIRGVKYRLAYRLGEPSAEYKADYLAAIDALQGVDRPKPMIDFSSRYKPSLFSDASCTIPGPLGIRE